MDQNGQKKLIQSGFGLIGVLVALAAIVAIGGGGYLVFKQKSQAVPAQQPASPQASSTASQASSPAQDATAGWKIYQWDTGRLLLKYPPGWKIEKDTYSNGGVTGEVGLFISPQNRKSSDYIEIAGLQEPNCYTPSLYVKCDQKTLLWTKSTNPEILKYFDLINSTVYFTY